MQAVFTVYCCGTKDLGYVCSLFLFPLCPHVSNELKFVKEIDKSQSSEFNQDMKVRRYKASRCYGIYVFI